jgi:hypothetical protein
MTVVVHRLRPQQNAYAAKTRPIKNDGVVHGLRRIAAEEILDR